MSVLYKALPFIKFKNEQHKTIVAAWYAAVLIDELTDRIIEPYNISLEQFRILHILLSVYPKPIPVYTIRHYMPVRSDLSRTVTGLNKRGLVQKSTSGKDKRVVPVMLSNSGLELINGALEKFESELVSLPILSTPEAVSASTGLEKLIDSIQKELRR